MKTTTKRKISFEQACSQYVHRFTMEHVPAWAREPMSNGSFYAPHYKTDREWYDNTYFYGENELADKRHCYSYNESWPLGNFLKSQYSK